VESKQFDGNNVMGEETFTIKEMREAYSRSLHGLSLTEKQKKLADAKRIATRWSVIGDNHASTHTI